MTAKLCHAVWIRATVTAALCLPTVSFGQPVKSNPFLIGGIQLNDSSLGSITEIGNRALITNCTPENSLGTSVWALESGANAATLIPELAGARIITQAGDRTLIANYSFDLEELNWGTNRVETVPFKGFSRGGRVTCSTYVGDRALIGTYEGLWALTKDSKEAIPISGPGVDRVYYIVEAGDRALIGMGTRGLWALANRSTAAVRIEGPNKTAHIFGITQVGDRALVIVNDGSGSSLWSLALRSDKAQLIDGMGDHPVEVIGQAGGRAIIGIGEGVWALNQGSLRAKRIAIFPNHPQDARRASGIVVVHSVTALGDDALIGTWGNGLWSLANGADAALQVSGIGEFDTVLHVEQAGDRVFVHTTSTTASERADKLWVVNLGANVAYPVDAIQLTDEVQCMVTTGERALVCTTRAVYQFRFTPDHKPWPVRCAVHCKLPGRTYAPATMTIRVTVEDQPGWVAAANAKGEVAVYNKDHTRIGTTRTFNGPAEIPFDIPQPGEYYAEAIVTSALGEQSQAARSAEHITVNPKPVGFLEAARNFAGTATVLWLAATLSLIVASRWFDPAFRLVTSPTISKISLFYVPLFEHVRPVRLWMLDRAYQRMRVKRGEPASSARPEIQPAVRKETPAPNKKKAHKPAVVRKPIPFVEPDADLASGEKAPALTALIEYFSPKGGFQKDRKRQLWISGQAGTGKSTLLEAFLERVTAPSTLAESWSKHGVVPCLIRVRDFGAGRIVDAVAHFFGPYGIDGEKLIERLLRTGDFLIMLDGANERDWDNAINLFLATFPEVPVIISSQTDPGSLQIDLWKLPPPDASFAKRVLTVHLSPPLTATAVPGSLWSELKSGYDVVLLAELIRSQRPIPIPDSQLGLYEATLNWADTQWKGAPAFASLGASLCQQAWNLWKKDSYQIEPSPNLPEAFIRHLCDEIHMMIRIGDHYQFRHDLMQQYLAARWIVKESVGMQDLVHRLKDEEIWRLGDTQQREVFKFITEMLASESQLRAVANFAGLNIDQRGALAAAVQHIARRRHWKISMDLSDC